MAIVRVYVANYAADLPAVTGTLSVARPGPDWRWTPLGGPIALSPAGITARAAPDYASERGRLSWTLNFRLPAWLVYGRMQITAQVSAPDAWSDPRGLEQAAETARVKRRTIDGFRPRRRRDRLPTD